MSRLRPLSGSCACGRIQYTITAPLQSSDSARVYFSQGTAHRRSQATPLAAWLRVPLSWYSSTTHALRADETHNTIRRTYTSPSDASSQRHFCGYCGTPLSYWSEDPPSEASYISITLGSLRSTDLQDLEELELLPTELLENTLDQSGVPEAADADLAPRRLGDSEVGPAAHEGLPWFQTMVEGSRLGNLKRSRGGGTSRDGTTKVEWEIMEWDGEGSQSLTPGMGKRKLEDNGEQGDAMQQ